MTDQVRFSLIGCGSIAKKHVKALTRLPEAEIVGVYDINHELAQTFAAEHGLVAYDSVDAMVEKADPDVFNVLTPSGLHHDVIMDLARYDRHFVVEKPLALRLDHIDAMLEECDLRGTKLFVIQQNRFNLPIVKLRQAVEAGRFGKMVMGTVRVRWKRDPEYYEAKPWRGTWLMDGGVLTNQASHHIDMLIWMMGEVDSVMAMTANRLADIEAEDTGLALLRFRSGALGVVEATTAARPKDLEGSISIMGEKGTVEVGGFFMNELKTWAFANEDSMDADVWENHARVPDEWAWGHAQYFENVVQSLKNNTQGLVDGLAGRRSVEIINAIYESAETGREVRLRFSPDKCKLGVGCAEAEGK